MASHLQSRRSFDELRWVIQIRQTLSEEVEDETDLPVSIFNVPQALKSSNPELYTPQQVAIGPYHHWRPELYEMERYKLAAAKRVQKNHQLGDFKFQNLVEQLIKLEGLVRACYHRYLDFNGETLGWMMAIDASFLLEYLQVYAMKERKALVRASSRMSHLVDYSRRKSAHSAILKDIAMLENQIPMFILRKVLDFQLCSVEESENMSVSMLMGLSKELSPFKMMEELPKVKVSDSAHLLDFLYRIIVPREDLQSEIIEDDHEEAESRNRGDEKSFLCKKLVDYVKQLLEDTRNLLSKLNRGPIRVILKLPWTIISNLPGISILKQPIDYLFFNESKKDEKTESDNPNRPPSVEEITIPSVSELSQSGVRFVPTNSNLLSISFDPKSDTFYLPVITLDINSEVIMRNIVAYEAANASGPLVFTRYTELMNGIIDTEEDAKYLREKGIILNHLKSDQEVADLWNGMSKSIQLTKVPFLDRTIEEVNKYYHGRWKVKIGKVLKNYVFGSWQFLIFLAAIMIFALLTLLAFCSLYSYARIFRINNTIS
ncbi:putative UPF0481 protein At3g02645 [Punica granatum]|nr:putative UPF0481 protein At3g02645 [Punica granatum]